MRAKEFITEEDYRGQHQAPGPDNGAPLHDLTGIYPDDIYGPNGALYYGHYGQNNPMDVASIIKIQRARGKPKKGIQIYRAVPKGVKTINPGDWVTINKDYATEHGAGWLEGKYRVLSKIVNAGDLYTDGNSIHEFGYYPANRPQEVVNELAVTPVSSDPHEKIWSVERGEGLPPSEVIIEREGSKVRVYATVNDRYTKPDDAEYASDAISLIRTWMKVIIEELPNFVRDTDSSIKIEAHGKRADIYSRFMPKILPGLQEVNTGWVYNKPYVNNIGATIFTFSNYNYDKDRGAANWSDKRTKVSEAEFNTVRSREISKTLKNAGYKMLGSGADATVWTKDEGVVIKIIMPDDVGTTATETFKKFYEFCVEHSDVECLPRFINIGGKAYSTFAIKGKEYTQIAMEQLFPIPEDSFKEAMVWQLSDLCTKRMRWEQALETIKDPNTWSGWSGKNNANSIIKEVNRLDEKEEAKYALLFTVMTLLYHTGRINKLGWDLHTENAMLRKDGTIVIVDPWFSIEENL